LQKRFITSMSVAPLSIHSIQGLIDKKLITNSTFVIIRFRLANESVKCFVHSGCGIACLSILRPTIRDIRLPLCCGLMSFRRPESNWADIRDQVCAPPKIVSLHYDSLPLTLTKTCLGQLVNCHNKAPLAFFSGVRLSSRGDHTIFRHVDETIRPVVE
jgi:5-methylcytosine-specific restriction endonuclease McrA